MKAASIVNEAYCVEQLKRLRKQLKPIAIILIETIKCGLTILVDHSAHY